MIASIPYGRGTIEVDVPNCIGICEPPNIEPVMDEEKIISQAIRNPIGTKMLREIAEGKETAAIVINDITRPCPTRIMVEQILEELNFGGIEDRNITIVVATGNHRAMTEEEYKAVLGEELCNRLKRASHNCMLANEMVAFGTTRRGVPIYINRIVAEADLVITTGLIAPHQSAGFSGGRKSIVPGVSGIETLTVHHSFPIRPIEPLMGKIEDNPFHEEALEGAKMVGVDFMVNTVQNSENKVLFAVAGDIEKAFYAGVELCKKVWGVLIDRLADVVIVSPGGYPRDIDLHQAQKAVAAGELAVKSDGVIILVAECMDGIGKFGAVLKRASSPAEVIENFKREGYTKDASSKAFMYARAMNNNKLIIVTDRIDHKELEQMFFIPALTLEDAIKTAIEIKGSQADFLVIPHASEILPIVKDQRR